MTKYCPKCESEFQDDLSKCPQDGETLQEAPSVESHRNIYIDIYAAANRIEAELIEGMLSDREIPSKLLTDKISQYPTLSDSHFIIAVKTENKSSALQAIAQARDDGIISQNGVFFLEK